MLSYLSIYSPLWPWIGVLLIFNAVIRLMTIEGLRYRTSKVRLLPPRPSAHTPQQSLSSTQARSNGHSPGGNGHALAIRQQQAPKALELRTKASALTRGERICKHLKTHRVVPACIVIGLIIGCSVSSVVNRKSSTVYRYDQTVASALPNLPGLTDAFSVPTSELSSWALLAGILSSSVRKQLILQLVSTC